MMSKRDKKEKTYIHKKGRCFSYFTLNVFFFLSSTGYIYILWDPENYSQIKK